MHSAKVMYCLCLLLLPTSAHSINVNYTWPPYGDDDIASSLNVNTVFSAVLKGNAKVLEQYFYCDGKADLALVAADNTSCVTLLNAAVQRGQALCTKTLLDNKASTEIPDQYGCTPVHWAAAYGHTMCLYFLIQAKADLTKTAGTWKVTPLHVASLTGNTDIVKMLIAAGVACNTKTKHGLTAYQLALNDSVKAVFAKNSEPIVEELDKYDIIRPLALMICDYINGNGLDNHQPLSPTLFDEKTSSTSEKFDTKLAQQYLWMALTDGKEPVMLKRGNLKIVDAKVWEQKTPTKPA